jgi:hypothetical protein
MSLMSAMSGGGLRPLQVISSPASRLLFQFIAPCRFPSKRLHLLSVSFYSFTLLPFARG